MFDNTIVKKIRKWAAPSENVLEHAQNAHTQIYAAHAQSLIRAFALHWYII